MFVDQIDEFFDFVQLSFNLLPSIFLGQSVGKQRQTLVNVVQMRPVGTQPLLMSLQKGESNNYLVECRSIDRRSKAGNSWSNGANLASVAKPRVIPDLARVTKKVTGKLGKE